MIDRKIVMLILISLIALGNANAQTNKGSRGIKKMIKAQSKAFKQGNIEFAVSKDHPNYIQYCAEVLRLALFADSTELMDVDIHKIDWVFDMRTSIPHDVLQEMDATSLLIYYSRRNKNRKSRFQYGSITATADSGYARIHDRNYPTPYFFRYYKIDGKWFVDRSEVFDYLVSVSTRNLAKQNCDPVNTYYPDLAETYRYTHPDIDPWKPIE